MNKNKLIVKKYSITIAALLMLIFIMIVYFTYNSYLDSQGKSAPQVAKVKEQLDQARALQKQGKLKESAEIFELFALQGYPDAMFYTAKAYEKGWGVLPNLEKSRAFLLNAVEYNFNYRGESAFQLGRLFQNSAGPNCNTIAVNWFKKALEWNYVKASLSLGTHYEKGLGVEQNLEKAIAYYQIASQEGIAIASLKHARILVSGKFGITKDIEFGRKLVSSAILQLTIEANKGKASAAKTLGRLYRDGNLLALENREDNKDKAIYWLRVASDLGNAGAMHDLGHLLIYLDEDKHHSEAITLFELAAEKGHGGAATALGRIYIEGKYGLKKTDAIKWFNEGVKAGHTGAMKALAILYYEGELIKKDMLKAIELLQKGANKGHSGSKRLLDKYLKENNKLNRVKSNKERQIAMK